MRFAGWYWLALCLPGLAAAADCRGPVLKVADGDTIEVRCAGVVERVRLSRIDAPEFRQRHGVRARNALAALVAGREVTLDIHGRDRYRRPLATVWVDGIDVNREMLRRGHAWVYRGETQDPALLEDERAAREQRLGLWSEPAPSPPWVYRRVAGK